MCNDTSMSRTFTSSDLRRYRQLLEERQRTVETLEELDRHIQMMERGDTGEDIEIPSRLVKTYLRLKALGGEAKLADVFEGRKKDLTRAGVRAQLEKLCDLGFVEKTEAWGGFRIRTSQKKEKPPR